MTKEIFTLQLGNAANYCGAHYWNLQASNILCNLILSLYASKNENKHEDLDILRLFQQENVSLSKNILTPRALVFDLKENFGSIKSTAEVYSEDNTSTDTDTNHSQESATDDNTEVYKQPIYNNTFNGNSIKDPRFWSDFTDTTFGYQSLHSISSIEFGSSLGEMKSFDEGYKVFKNIEQEDGVLDCEFRKIIEKCDNLETFQVFGDSNSGFSGFTNGYLEFLRDEYSKKQIILYSISNTPVHKWSYDQKSDLGINISQSTELDFPIIPLHVPRTQNLAKDSYESKYQLSALQSLVLDIISFSAISQDYSIDQILHKSKYSETGLPILSNLYASDYNSNLDLDESISFIDQISNKQVKSNYFKNNGWAVARGDAEFYKVLKPVNIELFIEPKLLLPPMFPTLTRNSLKKVQSHGSHISEIDIAYEFVCNDQSKEYTNEFRKELKKNANYKKVFGNDQVEQWNENILSLIEQNDDH
ncbi:hypothetical protein BB561_005776 [Smittium simulii]|uniref:Misato Segment II tubulin-like domain-containing protein n=1 Tax=Smittium simulii TaxID=133385 RepID=A0A2T9Y898_9FUNG|nr:hypothetical protein BB561_005776 [Smittium simulii]